MKCEAVRKKGSVDPCLSNAVIGRTLCGKHLRSKDVTLWSNAHASRIHKIVRFQSVFRGYHIRQLLKLAGPGVLNRKNLANEEDVVTTSEKDKVSPLNYFSFEENGKIWWFEFNTIWKWASGSIHPTNPYTKVLLNEETKRRLWSMWSSRILYKLSLPDESPMFNERIIARWNTICQIFIDNGFVDIHPTEFINLRTIGYICMFKLLYADYSGISYKESAHVKKIINYLEFLLKTNKPHRAILYSTYTLLLLLTICKQKNRYILVFHILSAFYRC